MHLDRPPNLRGAVSVSDNPTPATALPRIWCSNCYVIAADAKELRDRLAVLEAENARLKQLMWDAYAALGFDTDGDDTYHAWVGWPDGPHGFLAACVEFRNDYDEAFGGVPESPSTP